MNHAVGECPGIMSRPRLSRDDTFGKIFIIDLTLLHTWLWDSRRMLHSWSICFLTKGTDLSQTKISYANARTAVRTVMTVCTLFAMMVSALKPPLSILRASATRLATARVLRESKPVLPSLNMAHEIAVARAFRANKSPVTKSASCELTNGRAWVPWSHWDIRV